MGDGLPGRAYLFLFLFLFPAWLRAEGPVLYLTDLEGDYQKLVDFVRKSQDLVWLDKDGKLQIRDGITLVYGGDAVDQGPKSQKIVSTLVECKKRMIAQGRRDALVLIAGNRDLNKVRLQSELSDEAMRVLPEKFLGINTRANRFKWILDVTMGAAKAFEFRRRELQEAGKPDSDEDVVESYRTEIGPGGVFREFLELSQLAYRHGNALFVHGAITDENYLKVPGPGGTFAEVTDIDAMVEGLNRWYVSEMRKFTETGECPDLVAYQARVPKTLENQGSIVYGHYSDKSGNPVLPSKRVIEGLARAGIAWVFTGHRPYGQSASVMSAGDVRFILGDNSHQLEKKANFIMMSADGQRVLGRGESQLNSTGPFFDVNFVLRAGDKASLIGMRTWDGYLVRGELSDGRFLLAKVHPDYSRTEKIASLPALLAMAPRPPYNPSRAKGPCPVGWLRPRPVARK